MKRLVSILLLCSVLCGTLGLSGSALSVSAECAVLICADTGEVLYSHNGQKRHSMASTTKIMTALIALETGESQRLIQVTPKMTAVEGTSMGLLPGDTVTLYGLVCGMLLSSGNDAANSTAIVLSGSEEKFAKRMNQRAKEIGMADTHFVTPSGLDDEMHYSTAYDMALLGCAAIRNPLFFQICSSKSIAVEYGNPPYRRVLSNHNRLLSLYDSCVGIKTGFTKKSGRCLVSAAQQDGVTLVAVTLNAPDDWNDHMAMFRYGFSVKHSVRLDEDLSGISLPVCGGTRQSLPVRMAEKPSAVYDEKTEDIQRIIYMRQFVFAPVREGVVVGRAVYYSKGRIICESDIIASQSAESRPVITSVPNESLFQRVLEKIKGVY